MATSHSFARKLLDKPDCFLTATCEGKEFVIENFQMVSTHANMDDGVNHITLNLRECGNGNIKR